MIKDNITKKVFDPEECIRRGDEIIATRDYDEHYLACNWYVRAAILGDERAYKKISMAIEYGMTLDSDFTGAFKPIKKAADAGNSDAMLTLAFMCEHFYDCDYGYEEANKYCTKAVKCGNEAAKYFLTVGYTYGMMNSKRDKVDYYGLNMESLNAGCSYGYLGVGECYLDGIGVAVDEVKGNDYIRRAADMGNAAAQFLIGCRLRGGLGFAHPNDELSIEYLKMAARQGYKGACISLYGRGIKYREK